MGLFCCGTWLFNHWINHLCAQLCAKSPEEYKSTGPLTLKAFCRSAGEIWQPTSIISSAEASGMLPAVPAVVHKFIHSATSSWMPAWCWALFWTLEYSSEQTKTKSLPPRACSLMYALVKSDIFAILLDTEGEIRFISLEAQGRDLVQSSEKGDISVGWGDFRERKRIAVGPWRGSEFGRTQKNGREFWKGPGRQETKWAMMGEAEVGQAGKSGQVWLSDVGLLTAGVHSECWCRQWAAKLPNIWSRFGESFCLQPQLLPIAHCLFPTSALLINLHFLRIHLLRSHLPPSSHPSMVPFLPLLFYSHPTPLPHNQWEKSIKQKIILTEGWLEKQAFLENCSLTENYLCVNSLKLAKISQGSELAFVCDVIRSSNTTSEIAALSKH